MKRAGSHCLRMVVKMVCLGVFCAPLLASDPEPEDYKVLKNIIIHEFSGEKPHEWGPAVAGVKTRLKTPEKVLAVTVDASGAESGAKLLEALLADNVPVTLFAGGAWLEKNRETAKKLSANPLFEIANLGLESKSCSVDGQSPEGVATTRNVEEVFTEIEKNARKIESVTGELPRFFRAGRAYYDDVAVRIAKALGYEVVGMSVPDGKTAGFVRQKVRDILYQASAGSIAAIALDAPESDAAQELRDTVSKLRGKGFQFVKLTDYPLE